LYHWRVLPGSTALNINEKPYAIIAAEKALNDHVRRTNQSGIANYFHYGYKISYPEIHKTQKVAVFIPAYSESDLSQALELAKSLLTFGTIGEIVVLHNLHQADLKVADISNLSYRPLSSQYQGHITSSADLIALRSMALHESPLSNRLLLSSDATFVGEDWLFEMLAQISKQAVVAVSNAGFDNSGHFICGPKIINKSHQAITPFVGLLEQQVGYGGRNKLTQQLSALDLDCLLINTDLLKIDISTWDTIENTLEFFLKLRSMDLKLIWAPASKIYFTSPHRVNGTKPKEDKDAIHNSTLGNSFIDEFYSPNFLDGPHCFIIDHKLRAKSLETLKIPSNQSPHV
jgi:hypothetical protein